jgi:hypothetical protein
MDSDVLALWLVAVLDVKGRAEAHPYSVVVLERFSTWKGQSYVCPSCSAIQLKT